MRAQMHILLQENTPWAVSTVLQHIVGVGGVCEVELALDGHTAALLCLKTFYQDIIYKTNILYNAHNILKAHFSSLTETKKEWFQF